MDHLMCLDEGTFFPAHLKELYFNQWRQVSLNSLPIVNILDLDIKTFLWWELSKCFVCQSATEHPIVSTFPAHTSYHSWWCPFVMRQQLSDWPFNGTAVPGRDSWSPTRYGQHRGDTLQKVTGLMVYLKLLAVLFSTKGLTKKSVLAQIRCCVIILALDAVILFL